jgi:hypothetical protein
MGVTGGGHAAPAGCYSLCALQLLLPPLLLLQSHPFDGTRPGWTCCRRASHKSAFLACKGHRPTPAAPVCTAPHPPPLRVAGHHRPTERGDTTRHLVLLVVHTCVQVSGEVLLLPWRHRFPGVRHQVWAHRGADLLGPVVPGRSPLRGAAGRGGALSRLA